VHSARTFLRIKIVLQFHKADKTFSFCYFHYDELLYESITLNTITQKGLKLGLLSGETAAEQNRRQLLEEP